MSKGVKIFLFILLVIIAAGSIVAYQKWNKPTRDVANEKGILLTAPQLVTEYQASEESANLDKPIEVTGKIAEVKQNQAGQTTILLSSDDPFAGVFCTLKDSVGNLTPGSPVTIKGVCHGMLSDVRIGEAILVP
jgi:hypothetical protein